MNTNPDTATPSPIKLRGIFSWPGEERRSNRYGLVGLYPETFDNTVTEPVLYDKKQLASLSGKQVRVVATVLIARQSGHIGDLFLGIFPEQPMPGQVFDLGTGELFSEPLESSDGRDVASIGLKPSDGRQELWFDPHQLYKLHDQTVELEIIPTWVV